MRSKRNTVLARIGRSVWPMRQARATGRRRRRDARPLAVQQLEPKIALAADAGVISLTPSLVADINRIGRGSFPQDFTVAGGLAYFTAYDESSLDTVRGLWSTDGTAAGTTRLTSPDTRVGGSMGSTLLTIGSTMFFDVSGENGTELWKTNGTVASTERVSPESLSLGDGFDYPTECVAVGSTLFFLAEDEETGRELWRTDGTSTGTIRVVDINPGPQWSDPSWLTAVGSTIYFNAFDGDSTALWKSDGTPEGTTVVKDDVAAQRLVAVGSSLFFFQDVYLGNGQGSTTELWKSNGTPEGTALVKDLDSSWGVGELTPMGSSTLFFVFYNDETGQELWKSDGTSEGTVLVKDIRPGTWYDDYSGERPESSSPLGLTVVGSTLFFAADDGLTGRELWKSDGSAEGTVLVADLAEGTITYGEDEVPRGSNPNGLTAAGDQLFFFADKKLWKTNATGSSPTLVSDLAGDENTGSGSYGALAVLGGSLLFAATDDDHGTELWSTDLATGATGLLKDVNPRTDGAFGVNSFGGSASYAAGALFKGMLYFAADDGERGVELWRTDGTAAGTVLVKDIAEGMSPGYQGSYGYYASSGPASSHPSNFTIAGDTLFFTVNNPATGTELWKTDGTPNGTSVVVAAPAMVSVRVKNLTDNEVVVAVGPSDPTAFRTLYPEQITAFQVPRGFFEVNDQIETARFFTGTATTLYVGLTDYGIELTNTQFVDENTSPPSDGPSSPSNLTVVGATLYFVGLDQTGSYRVWKTDGTTTEAVQELESVSAGDLDFAGQMTSLGSSLYFRGIDEESGIAGLFQFDTATGVLSRSELASESATPSSVIAAIDTVLVDVPGIMALDSPSGVYNVAAMGSAVFFSAAGSRSGSHELWKTDASGTVLLADIKAGEEGSYPRHLTVVGSNLFFVANDGITGTELWKTDGTRAGTIRLADIHAGSSDSDPHELTPVGSFLYFTADDGVSGRELWKTDGTPGGTVRVADILQGSDGSEPSELIAVGSTVYFSALAGLTGRDLWKTDGSESGTVRVTDFFTGFDANPLFLTAVGSTLFFTADDSNYDRALWRTDGTPAGTVQVSDFAAGAGGAYPEYLTAVGSMLYFKDYRSDLGAELWKSDGTPTGTVLVADIRVGEGSSYPRYLTAVGSTIYFSADDGVSGRELWKTDGTPGGTVRVADIFQGSGGSEPYGLTAVGSMLYFVAGDGLSGRELWKTDGTPSGTVRVADIASGSISSDTHSLTPVGSTLYFAASDAYSGTVLYKTDGTEAGTLPATTPDFTFRPGEEPYYDGDTYASGLHRLTNPNAGVSGGFELLRAFTNIGLSASYGATAVLDGMLYFAADDGETGMELWRTDGTAQGTTLVADLHSGDDEYSYSIGSFPHSLFVMGDTLYFMATDAEGTSLWATDGSANNTAKVSVANGVSVRSLLGASGSTLFAVADNGTTGAEVWRLSQNAAPTGVTLTPASTSIAENTSTVARIKVADIAIADDAQGTNSVSLVGADAASFEASGAALYLKAGVALNFETKQTYAVTVSVADATVAGSAAVTAGFTLTVTDVPEAAVISLPTPFANTVTEDAGVDASGFLVTSGTFGIVDPDAGQAAFKTTVGVPAGLTNLGALTINSGGVFTYRVLNSLDAVQALRAGQTRSEVFTIESLDGTKLDVTFSISGVADVLRGVVADGYLAGATVFADVNRNRTFDAGELFTTTDASGNFSFDFGSLTATLVSVGGTDVSTGLPFAGSLTAPAGSTVINPLTTVVTAVIEASLGGAPPSDAAALASVVATATSKVTAGLGLPTTVNLTTFDPLAPTADQTVALAVQKVAAAIANVMVVANTVGADAGAVVRNLASAVTAAPNGATVNLADTSVLTQVLTAPGASGGAPSAPPAAAVVALTQSNSQISSAGNLGAIAQLQTSVQSAGGFVDENAVVSTIVYQAKAPAGMNGPVFSLKEVAGDDRSLLSIDAGTGAVRLLSPADYEAKGAYRFTVVASQQGHATVETVVSIRVNDLNEAPTGLAVSVTSVAENQPAGTVIGALSASDPDAGDTLTFALVAGDGSGDNGLFTIDGNQLKAASTFNFEVRNSYSVRIRVSDAKGLVTEVPLTISVADVADEPLVVERVTAPAPAIFSAGQRVQFAVTLSEIVQVRGKPQIQVRAGGATRTATYVSGSGSATLTFQYVVAKADAADVVSIGQKFVFAKKSAIVAGAEKLAAALPAGIAGLVADGVRIDAVPGSVIGKVGVPGGGTYRVGDSLDFIVRFSEAVIVSGVPQIGLTGLTGPRQATYVSGTGSTELTFRYVVRSGDAIRGKKGLGLAKVISLPGGASIGDEAGNRAVLKVSTPSLKAIRFDAVASVTEAAAPNKRSRAIAFAMLG